MERNTRVRALADSSVRFWGLFADQKMRGQESEIFEKDKNRELATD